MASLTIDGGELVISLSAWERLGSLHRGFRVPLRAVEAVGVTDEPFAELRGRRHPGTRVFYAIALGTWRERHQRGFAAIYGRKPAVTVRLRDGEFAWLCVTADAPHAVAEQIRHAL